jgi:outer membrane protein assembly factor BamE (lipoprotein component of BamABCDE complex)
MNRQTAISIFPALLVFCFVSLPGCHTVTAGKDFNSSVRTEIVLDKTTRDEVIKLFGSPAITQTVAIKGLDYEQYTYDFVKGKIPSYFEHLRGIGPKKPYIRALSIYFSNDRVQNYQLFSTFPEEFIVFDQGLIEKVIVNTTNESDLITMFGPPHGKSTATADTAKISPETTASANAVTVWSYRGIISNQNNEEKAKSLTLYLDNKGVVIKKAFE